MNIRQALIAFTAAASCAASAGAQPDKDQEQARAPLPASTPPVVLASVGDVHRPRASAAGPSVEPVRRPAPRVTTCRCGDPQPSQDQSTGEQPDQ